jgi:plasmid stabilization system protein ParE
VKVRLSDEAERELEEIGDRIASAGNPARAATFVEELRDACLGLADFPGRFPLVLRYEGIGIRHRLHGNYLIFYHIGDGEVAVIRILHGAMDYASLLFPD